MVPNAIVVDKSRDLVETWSTPIQTLPGNVLELLVYVNSDLTEDKKSLCRTINSCDCCLTRWTKRVFAVNPTCLNFSDTAKMRTLIIFGRATYAQPFTEAHQMKTELRLHISLSGTVIYGISLLPLSPKAKLDVCATAIEILAPFSRDRILPC